MANPTKLASTSKPRAPSEERAAEAPSPGFYLVATPIGNLRDITLRALDILRAADLIACEDTRVTGTLCRAYGITAKRLRYDEHSADRAGPEVIAKLQAGGVVALVSDAGTPLISDPGYRLARQVVAAGIPVTALPGASAVLDALVLSGLPTDRFLFAGFPDRQAASRRQDFTALARLAATLVFYEAPPRVAATLADLAAVFGPREAAVARELTKFYEEVRRDRLDRLAAYYAEAPPPRGEVVIVVGPPLPDAATSQSDIDTLLRGALATMSVRDAAESVAAASGTPKRAVYARALALTAPPPPALPEDR